MLPILIFEGMDKSGKTTLIKAIAKLTNFKYICIDRASVGFKAYNRILRKKHVESEYDELELSMSKVPHLMIYCRPNMPTIRKRLKDHNEQLPEGTTVTQTLTVYDQYFDESLLNKMMIDTGMPLHYCVEIIMARLNLFIQKSVVSKLASSMRFREPAAGMIKYHPVQLVLTDIDFEGVSYDLDVDRPYYDMLEGNLSHIVHKRDIGLINDRQMLYTSSDCVSLIQLDIDQDEILAHIHQRSLNMEKHSHNDICAIYDIIKRIVPGKRIQINYSIAFPHSIIRGVATNAK